MGCELDDSRTHQAPVASYQLGNGVASELQEERVTMLDRVFSRRGELLHDPERLLAYRPHTKGWGPAGCLIPDDPKPP